MNADSRPDEVFAIEPIDSGGLFAHLPWWLILTVAFLVTEMTKHPAIGVSVLCLKFGWNDFRTSFWLRRRDPIPRRREVCSLFYFASGIWRVCLWSFALMFGAIIFLVVIEEGPVRRARAPNAGPAMPPEVSACMVMWIMSFVVATLGTILSVLLAWFYRVNVWISGSISESRRQNEWPPRPRPRLPAESNLLKWSLIGSGAALFVVLFLIGIVFLFSGMDAMNGRAWNGNNQGAAAIFSMLVGGGILICSTILILVIGSRVLDRIGAKSPTECWPEQTEAIVETPSG